MNTKTVLMACAALCLVSCGGRGKKNSMQQDVERAVPNVRVELARSQKVPVDQRYSVTLQAFAVNNIAPQSGSRIMKINAEVGDFVDKGQVLAEMDKSNLVQTELQLRNRKDEYERTKTLYEKGGVSKSDFEAMQLQYEVNKTTYENLLTNTVLKSPLNGVVTARNYDEGDMYSMSAPLFVVQQINPMKARLNVSEKDYPYLKKGVKVEFSPEALPGKMYTGKVSRVFPTVDATTHTITVEVEIENGNYELRPGMYANARIIFGEEDAILVPDSAVVKQQGSGTRTVFVLNADNTVEVRVVELGRHIGKDYVIKNGIKAGEKVIIGGQSVLKGGSKVNVIE